MSIRREKKLSPFQIWAYMMLFISMLILCIWALTIKSNIYEPDCSASRQLFKNYVGQSVLEYYSGHTAKYDDLTKSAKKLVIRDHMCYSDALITWAVGN